MLPDMGNRGQTGTNRVLAIVLAVAIMAILGAFLGPVALDALNDDSSVTITQNDTTTKEVNARLDATLDSVDTTNDDATYTLNYSDGQTVTQKTIANGTTATFTFDNRDVNVTVNDVSTGEATAKFTYPSDFPYSDGARGIWGLVGLAVVLALLLAVMFKGMEMM